MKLSTHEPFIERRRMALLAPVPLRGNRRGGVDPRARSSDPSLTARQREVLGLLTRGLTNKEIARELGIGPDAVKRVISRLMTKLEAPSRTALAQQASQTEAARRERARGPNALSLLDAAPVPALVTRGAWHHVEYANPMARQILRDMGPGCRLSDLLAPAPRRIVQRIADESFTTGEPRRARAVALNDVDHAGSWRVVNVYASPMYDGANTLAGLVVFLVDATTDPTSLARAATDLRPA